MYVFLFLNSNRKVCGHGSRANVVRLRGRDVKARCGRYSSWLGVIGRGEKFTQPAPPQSSLSHIARLSRDPPGDPKDPRSNPTDIAYRPGMLKYGVARLG